MTDQEKLVALFEKYGLIIPSQRMVLTLANLRWLQRNLGIKNYFNPGYDEVLAEIDRLLKIYPEWKL